MRIALPAPIPQPHIESLEVTYIEIAPANRMRIHVVGADANGAHVGRPFSIDITGEPFKEAWMKPLPPGSLADIFGAIVAASLAARSEPEPPPADEATP